MESTKAVEAALKVPHQKNRDFLAARERDDIYRRIREVDSNTAKAVTGSSKAHDRIDELESEVEELKQTISDIREWAKTIVGKK